MFYADMLRFVWLFDQVYGPSPGKPQSWSKIRWTVPREREQSNNDNHRDCGKQRDTFPEDLSRNSLIFVFDLSHLSPNFENLKWKFTTNISRAPKTVEWIINKTFLHVFVLNVYMETHLSIKKLTKKRISSQRKNKNIRKSKGKRRATWYSSWTD